MSCHRSAWHAAFIAITAVSTAAWSANSAPLETAVSVASATAEGPVVLGAQDSLHRFELLADGALIAFEHAGDDATTIGRIRSHLRQMAEALASDELTDLALAHMREFPGVAALIARKDRVTMTYADLPRGGEVRVSTNDADALRAIHEFTTYAKKTHEACAAQHAAGDHGRAHHDCPHGAGHDPRHPGIHHPPPGATAHDGSARTSSPVRGQGAAR